MSIPISDAPVLIDPVAFSRQSRAEENPFLFQHAGLQYMLGVPGRIGTNGVGVFLTQDNGATWTELDSANAPEPGVARSPCAFYNAATGTLEIVYRNNTGHVVVTFTLNGVSSAWGTPGPTLTDNIGDQMFFCLLADGLTYELFTENALATQIVYYTYTISGGWSAATNLFGGAFSNSGSGIKGGALSSTDVAFFASIDNSNNVRAHRVTSSFTITTTLLGTGVNSRYTVKLDEPNDRVFFNWNSNQEIYADVGTPLSAPVYTHYTLFSVGGSSQSSYPTLGIDASGKFFSLFVQVDYGTTPITDRIWSTTFDGVSTWSTPSLYYDETANPPANSVPDPTNQFIHTMDVVTLANTHLLVVTAMETVDTAVNHCTGFALLDPPTGTQTLELTKIVAGGPAVPGDFTLTATGGSPESDISGDGHVGPTEVSTGTYELSETAFPDNTFDSQTGTWADNNNTWGGNYEAGAWDCGAAEMPTPTSVIVPAGGTVACTITNTFIPTPPPPPPPGPGNGQINAVGCWELLRLDVTLMPSRHLPTRGSVK